MPVELPKIKEVGVNRRNYHFGSSEGDKLNNFVSSSDPKSFR